MRPALLSLGELTPAPAGAGADNSVVLTVGGQSNADNSLFSYDAPIVTGLHLGAYDTRGTTDVTITGSN